MNLTKSTSEKRTYRTFKDEFVSREFMVSRTITVPEDLTPAQQKHEGYRLLTQLREEVMICFMLCKMMTHEEFVQDLKPFRELEEAFRAAAYPGTPPGVIPQHAPLSPVETAVVDSLVPA
jgi:hypothetical protein